MRKKMRRKTIVFISHYADGDGDIAAKLKEWIETQYRAKNVAVFSSSSEYGGDASDNSIKSGTLSMSAIDKHLVRHDVLISLLTPESVKRPWVVFEAGVGFGKGKAFLPILCRGGKLNSLPKPFSDLYVREASSKQKFNTILKEIDKALGYKHTSVGVEELRNCLCASAAPQHDQHVTWGGVPAGDDHSGGVDPNAYPHPGSYLHPSRGNEISDDFDNNDISRDS